MKPTEATDIVIIDETESCPYLEGKIARMPLRMPLGKITLEQADLRLAEGNRRTGEFIYQTNCPDCNACEPIRLDCLDFKFSRNQRRSVSKGNRKFRQEIGPLKSDAPRISMFNKHRRLRGLAKKATDIDMEEYVWGFVRSCFESFEITYWLDDQLVCLAVCDKGLTSMSAVYTFFDPDLNSDGLGTYSIFKQIEYCQKMGLRHLYLGYYVAESKHMQYKSRFTPNERLIDGQWIRFE
jgi:arginyl-tRNA--protein-N-Asp/Glu arginylyltransferase